MKELIGEGTELTALQMGLRAIIVFVAALAFLRISGRRTFGMRSPFDNVIAILLGAVLSRAIVGASPFWQVLFASFVIVLMHRLIAWISLHSDRFGRIVKGDPRIICEDGRMLRDEMRKGLLSEKDLYENLRNNGGIESLEEVKRAYLERDGKVSIIKKKPDAPFVMEE